MNFYLVFHLLMYFFKSYLMGVFCLLISLLISCWLFMFLNTNQSEMWPLNSGGYFSADVCMVINL
jgi:hypothetical protein